MFGGEHLMYSPQLLGKSLQVAADDEIVAERERFEAICLLLQTNKTRYSELLDDLRKGVHKRCDEYPKTMSWAYKLLLRTSRQLKIRKSSYENRFKRRSVPRYNNQNFILAQQGQRRDTDKSTSTSNRKLVPRGNGILFKNST